MPRLTAEYHFTDCSFELFDKNLFTHSLNNLNLLIYLNERRILCMNLELFIENSLEMLTSNVCVCVHV